MSRRLTNVLREAILHKAIEQAFKSKDALQQQANNAFALDLYHHSYGAHEKAMRALPKGFMQTRELTKISIQGEEYGWDEIKKCVFPKSMPFPYTTTDFDSVKREHPMWERGRQLILQIKQLKVERDQFERDTRTLLYSVTTTEKLLSVWPEIARFIPAEEEKKPMIPYDLTIKLNERLGFTGAAAA
jgi:hypothetical protein